MGEIDDRIGPSPRQLVVLGQTECDHAGNRRLESRIAGGEHRQTRAFGDADENRLGCRAGRGKVHEHAIVVRYIRRAQRRVAGETFQIRFDIEPDDEMAARRQRLRHMRAQVEPSAVSARYEHRRIAACAVKVQDLRPAAHADRVARLSNISGRRRRAAHEDEKHNAGPVRCWVAESKGGWVRHRSINGQDEHGAVVVPTVDRCACVRCFG